ncbi:MAG TPA: hypothetical protein VEI82_05885 [Myxococcota bacterium]|nr:hypothetical protein [Myxococcota bacterium]
MRSNEIFSRMSPEAALSFLEEVHRDAPKVEEIALSAAAGAFRLRPVFLRRQPRKRQAEWMRQALSRASFAAVAEELLAEYFLEYHAELLGELLDALGLEHEKGVLKVDGPACPEKPVLQAAVAKFRQGPESERRELLLRAFAAQTAIDWPDLEALL